MTDQEKRIKIAEVCGWREAFPQNKEPHPETKKGGILLPYRWINEKTGNRQQHLPDYLNDLNAMHEAEKTLDANGLICDRNIYSHKLRMLVHPATHMNDDWLGWCLLHATAAQRAEAFLKTLNL